MPSSLDATRLEAGLPERIAARMRLLLASVPDPDRARLYLERLRQDSGSAFDRVASSPAALRCAINLFSYSQFLSEAVLRNPERILQVANSGSFYRVLTTEEYEERLFEFLGDDCPGVPPAFAWRASAAANCCASRYATCSASPRSPDITEDLSNLADAILDVAYRRLRADFVERHGEPRLPDGGAMRFFGHLAGQARRAGAELQLRYRLDVRIWRQRRNRWPGAHHQQGVLQESRQPVHCRCSPPIPPKGSAIAWICVCVRMAPSARSAFPWTARGPTIPNGPATGKSRCSSRRAFRPANRRPGPRCWNSSNRSSTAARSISAPWRPFRKRASASEKSWRPGADCRGAWISSSPPAASAISNSWCSACSGCTAAASPGCATAAP